MKNGPQNRKQRVCETKQTSLESCAKGDVFIESNKHFTDFLNEASFYSQMYITYICRCCRDFLLFMSSWAPNIVQSDIIAWRKPIISDWRGGASHWTRIKEDTVLSSKKEDKLEDSRLPLLHILQKHAGKGCHLQGTRKRPFPTCSLLWSRRGTICTFQLTLYPNTSGKKRSHRYKSLRSRPVFKLNCSSHYL